MEVKIQQERENYKMDYRIRWMPYKKKLLRVFIDDERPIEQGDILGDFAWRREVTYTPIAKDKTFRQTIADYLGCDVEGLKFVFDRYCGCSMCACSPGIVVYSKEPVPFDHKSPAIWVTIK